MAIARQRVGGVSPLEATVENEQAVYKVASLAFNSLPYCFLWCILFQQCPIFKYPSLIEDSCVLPQQLLTQRD